MSPSPCTDSQHPGNGDSPAHVQAHPTVCPSSHLLIQVNVQCSVGVIGVFVIFVTRQSILQEGRVHGSVKEQPWALLEAPVPSAAGDNCLDSHIYTHMCQVPSVLGNTQPGSTAFSATQSWGCQSKSRVKYYPSRRACTTGQCVAVCVQGACPFRDTQTSLL